MNWTATIFVAASSVIGAVALAATAASPTGQSPAPAAAPAAIDFDRDIRPIFAENCYECHGPNERYRETNFHLDTEEGSYLDDGVIVPGSAAKSRLIQRITHPDPIDRMPPADSGYDPLTPRQIELLRRWIDDGAKWPKR